MGKQVEIMAEISRFEQVLESVETLSIEEQETLIQVVQRRIVEKKAPR